MVLLLFDPAFFMPFCGTFMERHGPAKITKEDCSKHPERVKEVLRAIPPGVLPRQGTSLAFPLQIPDLIGVTERKYLDHTGLQHNRSLVI